MLGSSSSSEAEAELNFVNLYPSAIKDFHATVRKGGHLETTTDLFTSPGVFLVVHESEEECEAAIQAVRKAERAILSHAIGQKLEGQRSTSVKLPLAVDDIDFDVDSDASTVEMEEFRSCMKFNQVQPTSGSSYHSLDAQTPVIVVVDPFSSGRYLIAELLNRGEQLVAVQSSQKLPFFSAAIEPDREALRKGQSARFLAIFDHIDTEFSDECENQLRLTDEKKDAEDAEFITNSARATLDCIKKAGFDVHAVVAGSEPGVELAEQLQAAMGFVERNSVRTQMLRRDKYPMQEALRAANLRAIKQTFAKTPAEVFSWMEEADMEFPLILKPAMGAGTEGVRKCDNAEDVIRSFETECTSGKVNICGVQNAGLIAQEFLKGTEYVVDSISCGKGQHAVVAMFRYQKLPDLTYEYTKLIDSNGEIQDSLRAYIAKVLDTVGLYFGASHAEVIVTKDGPCLVEVGARMHGASGPAVMHDATGLGIHEVVAGLTIGGQAADQVRDLVKSDYRYKLLRHSYEGKLNNRPEWGLTGTIQHEIGAFLPGDHEQMLGSSSSSEAEAELNFVNLYPSAIKDFHATVHKDGQLEITTDLFTSPGVFLVVHESEEECEAAIQAVRKAERAILSHAIGHKFERQRSPSVQVPLAVDDVDVDSEASTALESARISEL
jgi:biotin carboxylase